MRKDFLQFSLALCIVSLFYIAITPLIKNQICETKIVKITNTDIYFTNQYGNFKVKRLEGEKTHQINHIYEDTTSYYDLFHEALDDKTIANLCQNSNLSKFHCFLSKTYIADFFCLAICCISMFFFAICLFSLGLFLFKILKKT